jgi:hypothetical protein
METNAQASSSPEADRAQWLALVGSGLLAAVIAAIGLLAPF